MWLLWIIKKNPFALSRQGRLFLIMCYSWLCVLSSFAWHVCLLSWNKQSSSLTLFIMGSFHCVWRVVKEKYIKRGNDNQIPWIQSHNCIFHLFSRLSIWDHWEPQNFFQQQEQSFLLLFVCLQNIILKNDGSNNISKNNIWIYRWWENDYSNSAECVGHYKVIDIYQAPTMCPVLC